MKRLTSPDGLLVRRARLGDRRAARLLASRHLERVATLATVVGVTAPRSAQLARDGFRLALRRPEGFSEALLHAFCSLAATAPDREAAQGRLLALLVDLEQRSPADAAAVLGLSPAEAAARRELTGSVTGALVSGKSCRGWGLASGHRALSAAERTAGEAHLALCRGCRERRAQLDREQRELVVRAAGVATVIGAADVATLVLAPAGVLAGKAGIAAIGALGATALATGGLVATGELPFWTSPTAVESPAPAEGGPAWGTCGAACAVPSPGAGSTTGARPAPSPAPSVPAGPLPSAPALPTAPRLDVPALPLPTSLLSPLPTSVPLPLPSSLQLPLPSTSPIPLPTELKLPQLLP
jgi:hypothetical protein